MGLLQQPPGDRFGTSEVEPHEMHRKPARLARASASSLAVQRLMLAELFEHDHRQQA